MTIRKLAPSNWDQLKLSLIKNTKGIDVNHDPVCGKRMNANKAHIKIKYKHRTFYLCCPLCQKEFERNHEKYFRKISSKSRSRALRNKVVHEGETNERDKSICPMRPCK